MSSIQNRIDVLLEACQNWLTNDNHYLLEAVERTVEENYFSLEDVKFALETLKQNLNREAVEEWIARAELTDKRNASGKNVLCLHAGNLPLVGFQDAFATLLSGARYTGKISRKDPYLLPTFLNEVKKMNIWSDQDVQWTHRLDDFEYMQNDAVIFAGSETSVPGVKEALEKYHMVKPDSRFLIRTAHFSLAYIENKKEETLQQLTEGILRYGGKGCRSVAIVVAPFSLNEVRDELKRQAEEFWQEYPQHKKSAHKLKQQYAYNEAIERPQLWLKKFLLQEGGLELDQDFVCYWIQGNESDVVRLAEEHSKNLQSIYVTDSDITIPDLGFHNEPLSTAQQPPIYWKPDRVDTLKWLLNS